MPRHYEPTTTRRRQVAEAALATIAELGVTRFTTRVLAARVGISDGTLFRHFGNKEEIVLEAMGLLEAGIDASLVETDNPRADLEAFFRHRAAFVGEWGSVGRLIFSDELVHLAGDAGRYRVQRWREKSVDYLRRRLEALSAEGLLSAALDVRALSMLIQGTLLTFAMGASLKQAGQAGGVLIHEDLEGQVQDAWRTLNTILFG